MSQFNVVVEHGQSEARAAKTLQNAVPDIQAMFGVLVRRATWGEDGRSVVLKGPSCEVELWVDEKNLHAEGRVPMALKMLEGQLRRYAKKAVDA